MLKQLMVTAKIAGTSITNFMITISKVKKKKKGSVYYLNE